MNNMLYKSLLISYHFLRPYSIYVQYTSSQPTDVLLTSKSPMFKGFETPRTNHQQISDAFINVKTPASNNGDSSSDTLTEIPSNELDLTV